MCYITYGYEGEVICGKNRVLETAAPFSIELRAAEVDGP